MYKLYIYKLHLTCTNMIYAVRVYEVSESSAFKLCECCELANLFWQFVPGTRSRKLKRGLSTFGLNLW